MKNISKIIGVVAVVTGCLALVAGLFAGSGSLILTGSVALANGVIGFNYGR